MNVLLYQLSNKAWKTPTLQLQTIICPIMNIN